MLGVIGDDVWSDGVKPFWKPLCAHEEQSSITYAGAITTPTLILHDTGDPTVPISNSYEMYSRA